MRAARVWGGWQNFGVDRIHASSETAAANMLRHPIELRPQTVIRSRRRVHDADASSRHPAALSYTLPHHARHASTVVMTT
jgi:hypothetical protein